MIELIVEKSRDNKLLAGLAGIVLVGLIFGGFFGSILQSLIKENH